MATHDGSFGFEIRLTNMNMGKTALTSIQCIAYLVAVFAALITGAISTSIISQCSDHSSNSYRMNGMDELWWVPDPAMCAVFIIAFIFAGPKTVVISFVPWLLSLNLMKKYRSEGVIAFLLAGVFIGVLVGFMALPLLNLALHPNHVMIIALWRLWAGSWKDIALLLATYSGSGLVGGLTYWWISWQDNRFKLN